MKRKHFIIALMAMLSCFAFTARAQVAKVGNTEYATIDEAIAAWANNTTLTLLSNVTLSDVVVLKSTEHHILNLGTYTMTAASGKHAIEITCEGRSSASYALTVNADASNPGGITATGKSCIYYKKSGSTKDRPIILINNGVFTGSYSLNLTSNGNTNCPQIWINGGVFNSYMNLTKCMLKVSGGTFHAAINCTGDSSAYREIKGGRFKSWQFMTADAPNKFWVGSGNGNYNVGVYVDKEGYLCVGGPVITELSAQYPAKASNYSKWSSYLKYSSAAANGLYYEDPAAAIKKHGESNVTVWEGAKVVEELEKNEAIDYTPKLPTEVKTFEVEVADVVIENETTTKVVFTVTPSNASGNKVSAPSATITFRLPVPAAWAGKEVYVSHDGARMDGKYTVQSGNYVEVTSASFSEFAVEPVPPVAKIGEVEYYTLADAIAAAQADDEIVIIADVELTETTEFPAGKKLTLDLNGKTITGVATSADRHIYALRNNGNLTIKDSKGNGSISARGIYNGTSGENTTAVLVVEGGTFYALDANGGASIFNYANLTVNGGTFDGQVAALNGESGEVVINGGTFRSTNNYVIQNKGYKLTINKATVDRGFGAVGCYGGTTVINDGAFNPTGMKANTCHVVYVAGAADVTINGGTFKMNYPADGTPDSGSAVASYYNGKLSITGGTFYAHFDNVSPVELSANSVITGGTYYNHSGAASNHSYVQNFVKAGYMLGTDGTVAAKSVASINGTKYTSLSEAVYAVQEGETITLIDNVVLAERVTIPANKTLTIDLNGKSISMEESIIATAYAINNLGNLTITDGVGGGSINARGVYNGYGDGGANVTSATITVSGGTFNAKGTNGGAAIFNYGTANVNGGKFTSIGGYSLNNQAGASMIIADGVTANNGIYASNATLVVNGGEINGNRSGCHVLYSWNSAVTINGGTFYNYNSGNSTIMAAGTTKLTIKDGTFGIKDGRVPGNGNTWTSCLTDTQNSAEMTVNGGTFNGGFRVQAGTSMTINGGSFNDVYGSNYNIYGTVTVTGGTFTDATAKAFATKYVSDDYKLGEDGKVVYAPVVAKIGETKYETLDAAVAAAKVGDKITLLNDADLAFAHNPQYNNVYASEIDLNGKTMTIKKGDVRFDNVTIKNGNIIVQPGTYNGTAIFLMYSKNLTFDGVKVTATGVASTYLIGLEGTSNLNLLNGSEIVINNESLVNIGSIIADNGNGNTVTIKDSKIEITNSNARLYLGGTNGNITVENSDIDLNGVKEGFYLRAGQTLAITGTSTVDITLNSTEGRYGINLTDLTATYTKAETATVNATVYEIKVAKVGDVEFKTLQEAVAAVEDGGTITLIANETFTKNNRFNNGGWWDGLGYSGDKSFTIDLAGFTISQDGSLNDYLLWFKNAGSKENTITIKNGTLDAGTTAFCALCTASSHDNKLTINTENVNLINNISNGSTVKIRAGSVYNAKAGTIITGKNSYLGIENWKATVNIYDGAEIYMNGTASYNGCLVGASGGGTVNVYGGYGKGVKGGFIAMTSGGTINVAGGEWIANTDGTVGNNSNLYVLTAQSNKYESGFAGASIINVTGGTLRGGMDAWVLNNLEGEKAELNISGGNFNANPSSYVAENCIATENNGVWTVAKAAAKIGTKKFATLQEAVNAVQNGETITLTSDVTENVTLTEKVGLRYTINGDGKTLNGKITITPLSDENDNRRITIKNIKFENTADAARDFISCTETNHYPRLTVEGCTFTGNGKDTDVAVRLKTAYGAVIKDCTGTGLHSFLQNTAGKNLTIENVTVTDSKSGFALGTVQGVTVKGCKANVEGYGIRLDAQYNNNAVIESNTVKAFIPVVVRKAEVNSDVTVKGENTMTATNTDGIWFAAGTSEYETNGTMPTDATGKVKVILEDKNLDLNGVYGNYGVASIGNAKFNTLAEAVNAAQAGSEIKLLADVTLAGGYEDATEGLRIEKEITLNGNGYTINCGNFLKGIRVYNPSNVSDFNVNFNNVKVVNNVEKGRCIDTRSGNINLKVNSSTLIATNGNSQPLTIGGNDPVHRVTLNETSIDAGASGYAVISFVSTNVDIQGVNNSTISGFAAFYLKGDAKTTNLNLGQGVYTGTNNHAIESGVFGTVVLEGDNNVVNLMGTSATVKAIANNTAPQAAFLVRGANNTIKITKESAKIITEGNAYEAMVKADNAATTKFVDMGIERKLVAENRGYQFYSFEEAVRFAGNEGTIKVVNDFELAEAWTVAAGQNITLDLNGKTISQTKECTASYEMICNKGNLTITDSSDAKDGKISFKDTSAGDSSFGWGSYTVRNEGNLVVENGIIEHLGEQTFGTHCIMAIYQYCGSTTINGGTISTPNYRSARLWKGEMAINGGTFDGQLWVQAVDNTAKLTINGGTFEPNGNDASAVFVTNSTYDVAFAVTGGTFNGKVGCSDATKLANVITGGKFNAAAVAGTSKDLIAFGYEFGAADADGYQTVYNDENVLYIETLADLKAFRDAVNSGANYYAGVNVVLAADIDMAGENWVGIGSAAKDHGFMGNFDGQGYKIKNLTITDPALDSDGYAYAGLFGVTEGTDKDNQNTIKNLTIENVTITTTGHIVSAAIAYPYYTIVDNVKVCGDIKIQGGNYTAGVLAYTRRCVNASNLSIVGNEGSFVKGNQVVGGVISDIQMNGGLVAEYSNFSAEGVTVTGTKNVGGISGIIATQTLNGAVVKNVTLNSDNAQVGIVAGCLGGTSTISNVTYENVAGATTLLGATYEGGAITAKIGDTYYATFENAYKAAQEGETITMLAPVVIASGETLTLDKNVTVAYTSNVAGEDMFTNRGTLNISAGTITYANTDATASNVTVSTISSEPGSVLNITGGTVENKTVKADGSSIYSFAIDMLTNGNLGDVTATINGGTVSSDYMAIRQFNNGTACKNTLNITGGHIYGAKRAVQVHIDNNAAYTTISGGKVEAGADGYAICNFAATGNLEVTGGEFIGAVYSALENFISGGTYNSPVEATYCAAGYMPNKNADGTYGVVLAQDVVASIDGVTYGSLKAAVAAAKAGETITLLQDVKENVTISKHLTIDGAGKTITGMITTDGKSLKVTIKKVNFNGNNKAIYYAVKADDDLNLVVENCSVDSYSYGFLYANKSNDKIVVKDVTVENCASYGAYLVSFNSATFENFTVSGAQYGVAVSNAAARKVSFKNVSFDVTGTPLYINEQGTGNVTFNFSGINDMGKAPYYTSQYVKVVAAAQVGTKVCGSLQDAVVAAEDGETVKVLSDLNMTTANFVTQVDGYATLVNVAGKAVTIDLNGKTVTVNAAHADLNGKAKGNMLMSVFHADPNGTLTLTDNSAEGTGTVELYANDATVYGLIVSENAYDKSNPGKIIVNGGNYVADKVGDSMVFADINEVITVNGGNFHLGNVGTGVNGKPWIFNAAGNNQIHINVNGGTYNANVAKQYWTYEVNIGSGFTIRDNGDGTWSVVTGITLVDGEFTEYTNNETKEVEYISYTRNNIPTTWTSIYLPFEVPVSVLADQGFEVAYINGVRRDDKNDDGILDEFAMETIYIHGGDNCDGRNKTLKANYPYFIRTKGSTRKNLEITLEDWILYAAKDATYDCTTMTEKYEITGNSSQMTIVNKYGISGGGWTYLNSAQTLKPFRFYMLITSRDNSEPVIITSPMRIVVRGHENEDGTTTIYDVVGTKQNSDVIYDIHGRRVLDPQKGNLYIINGKKVVY